MARSLSAAVCVTLLTCAACSSPSEPVEAELTGVTARGAAIAYASFSNNADAFTNITTVPGDPAAVVCPRGGTLRTSVVSAASTPARLAVVFASCAVADSAGQLWTFTSLPQLDLNVSVTSSDTLTRTVTTTIGRLRVDSPAGRGICAINGRQEVELARNRLRVRQSGQYCGQVMDTTWTGTLQPK